MRVKKLTEGFVIEENGNKRAFTNITDLKQHLYSKVNTMVNTLSNLTPEVEITMSVNTTPSCD